MIIYGLTGGIGSGKSTVAGMFRDRGVMVHDSDQLGRELLADGSEYSRQVAERFPECSPGAARIDRARLGRLVFSDAGARKWLEELLHPAIWTEFLSRANAADNPRLPFCIIEGAVLLESDMQFPLAGLIVVSAPTSIRKQRLRQRGDLDDEQIQARMAVQLPEHVKLLKASHLIDNAGDLEQTRQQVDAVLAAIVKELGGPQ